jgi:hypothetical protein
MSGIAQLEKTTHGHAAKPSANNEWLRIHNRQVMDTVKESTAFKRYEEGKKMIAYLCSRHPELKDRWTEKEKRNRIAFVKRMMELNRKCLSARAGCTKTSSATK